MFIPTRIRPLTAVRLLHHLVLPLSMTRSWSRGYDVEATTQSNKNGKFHPARSTRSTIMSRQNIMSHPMLVRMGDRLV